MTTLLKPILIQQRTPHDCAIACLAMLTGKTWDATNAIVGHLVDYVGERRGMRDAEEALKLLGFSDEHGDGVGDYRSIYRGWHISTEYFRSTAWGRRALMSVPSLNNPGGWHMVFWDGARVLDPSTLKTYKDWKDLEPREMWIFREAGRAA